MSICSFDSLYLNLIETILELLSEKIMKSYSSFQQDHHFSKQFLDLYSRVIRQESQKSYKSNFSAALQNLSNFLISKSPDFRCESSGSSVSRSDTASPGLYDQIHTAKAQFAYPKGQLDEIIEEDHPLPHLRYHSEPRKGREIPKKSSMKYSFVKSFGKEDIMGKYAKMTEKFMGKQKKEESLYFNNGIFFHVP